MGIALSGLLCGACASFEAVNQPIAAVEPSAGMNQVRQQRGLLALPTRFGLSSGPAVVDNVGALERLNCTVLGDTVNTASRLAAINARYGTSALATEPLGRAAGPQFAWRRIDHVAERASPKA